MMTAFARTIILYFLIMVGLRLMGKRQIGELEPSELVLTMMISDLATVPMQDFGIPLLAGVIPILTLLAISMLLSQLSLHNLRFRRLLCGAPTVLIVLADAKSPHAVQDGSLVIGNLMNAASALGLGSCWINRAKEVFDSPEGKALLKKWGIKGEYTGVGNCILGYPDEEREMKPRKENYVYYVG